MLINTLPVLEAQASSEIENIVTTADRLWLSRHAQIDAGADPATREALRYRRALLEGGRSIERRPLTDRLTSRPFDGTCAASGSCDRCNRVDGGAPGTNAPGTNHPGPHHPGTN